MAPSSADDLVADTLVKVTDGGSSPIDGIIFDTPSRKKVVVAVMDATRGPVLRTVNPKTLKKRKAKGGDDEALRLLIRRTPQSSRGAARDGAGGVAARAGHTRAAMHRTTGK